MNTNTLIGAQQTAVDSLLAAKDTTEASMDFGLAWMKKNPRVIRGIKYQYMAAALEMGFDLEQSLVQFEDIMAMAVLEREAE